MKFSEEQLDKLAPIGVFRPNKMHDCSRTDLTNEPFMAIDPADAAEIDDAIRVTRFRGGRFVVEVAIADAVQIDGRQDLVEAAIGRRFNTYAKGSPEPDILPYGVVRDLELARGVRRALVVSHEYSAEGVPHEEVEILPALIHSEPTTYRDFGFDCINVARRTPHDHPIVAFNQLFRRACGLKLRNIRAVGHELNPEKYGRRLVQNYMVLANMAIARWAEQREVPILYREFDPEKSVWDEDREELTVCATYTTEPGKHHDISRFAQEETPYTHATSPLRRTVDLVNHLQIGRYLAGQELAYDASDLQTLSQHFNRPHIALAA